MFCKGAFYLLKEKTVNRQDYAAKRELKKQNRLDAGLISGRFPEVSGMVIHMTYSQKVLNPILMERTINICPDSYAYFNMECMTKSCSNGGFDLTSIIADMVKKHTKSAKGEINCKGEVGVAASGHAFVLYEISIQYKK